MKPFRFLLFTLLAALASCSDGIEDVAPAITSYTGLALAVPQVTVSSASKTMNATQEECTAQDLYLFCYPQNGKGTFLSQELTGLTAQTDLNGDASLYNIILQPGTYHVYVVANMENNSIWMDDNGTQKLFKDLTEEQLQALTEEQLKALTLSYDATTLPTAGNIPMVYASDKDVVVYDGKATEVAANLTFTCAKVVVNIIFDPDNTSEAPKAAKVFNGINWLLTPVEAVKGNNLTSSTNLFTAPATSGDGALSGVALPAGKFYDNYTYNEAYKNETNKDVVTPSGAAVTKPTNARPWLYRATYYLPERSVTDVNKATALPVTGKIIGGKEYTNTYNNISGENLSTKSTENSTDYYKLERGHYYEIVSFVNGLGQYDLPTTVNVKDWETVNISADFLHTTLWVEKTQICTTEDPLTTLTTARLAYKTNALPADITIGCDTKVGEMPVISYTNDETNKVLTFTVNPNIPFSSYTDENKENKAKVWIKAGNIKKYIDVYYSAEPFLIVTPQEEVIYWNNDGGDAELKKVIKFKTNLGGIKFQSSDLPDFFNETKGGSHKFGDSKITVSCGPNNPNNVAEGTITVTADTDPVTTTEHTFKVLPLTDSYKSYAKDVKVTVKPATGSYRIYMRAINDMQWYQGGTASAEWADILDEDYSSTGTTNVSNWRDGWGAENWNNNAQEDRHYAYIYTQIGETNVATDKMPMWRFSKAFPGDQLTADGNNPGWYYIDEKEDKVSEYTNKSGTKTITPGQTLIIFSNNTYVDKGYTLHRFTHHLEPGIPLFNFDDNEGWYLYDPLSDPYYRVFDDKPEIEDITYVIYTKEYVQGWYHNYGVANDETDPKKIVMYSVWDNSLKIEGSTTNGWYKTTLKFKCAKGFYEKAITLCLGGSDALHPAYRVLLLNGASWTPTGKTITGYYDGSWHEGTPAGAAKRRR